ncbi:HD domain-containing protein [Pseudooceanicola aestuarii]|uniref:HD domain-containing protein n=1 Tax=Pseudooceanicola aestuarii TaxID=2697319 RepID=UPI0013D65A0F|nr:HD domain-containing protein [Pseudooceanicola aestuarii]
MADTPDPRLTAQLDFLTQADRLKSVLRQTTLCDGSRRENSGEHSWHLALYAMTLGEHAPEGVQIDRVIRMLLLHDLVEIDAGDVPIYTQSAENADAIAAAEARAADRIFGLLPAPQAREFRALWDEFEAAQTPDAQFAKALDRFQPPIQNIASAGQSWLDQGVTYDMVDSRVGRVVRRSVPALWDHISGTVKALLAR